MNGLKKRWDITKNWHLVYPIVGLLGLGYSSFKLAMLFGSLNSLLTVVLAIVLFFVLLKATLALFKFLEKRWKVTYRWQVIRIFIVFAITGSLSVIVTKPLFELVGITKANFSKFTLGIALFYVLKFFLILPIYKILLAFFGWLFGEYRFFLNFALKMASRMGFKRFLEKFAPKQ